MRPPRFPGRTAPVLAALLLAAALALVAGFLWIPSAQSGDADPWRSICRAAGVPLRYQPPPLPERARIRASAVIVSPAMLPSPGEQASGSGATLAMRCSMCHGARGAGVAGAPLLAGQPAAAIYKQLRDFQSGHRGSQVMQAVAADLSDDAMRDLAAYYASLPRERWPAPAPAAMPRLVSNGAPMRSLPACAACHAAEVGKAAVPLLDGQPRAYLVAQLQAFASGARHNDINRQMRHVATALTPAEIDAVATFYAYR